MSKKEHIVRVHFIDNSERTVPAKDFQYVGEEGARRATAIVDGREVPIYRRSEPEWGNRWEEQERENILIDGEALSDDQLVEIYAGDDVRIIQVAMIAEAAKPNAEIRLDAKAATKLYDFLLLHMDRIHRVAEARKETT
jgi:hypothetical protein